MLQAMLRNLRSHAKILQFDVDAAEMNKNVLIDEGVIGDLKVVLSQINKELEQQDHADWIAKIQRL